MSFLLVVVALFHTAWAGTVRVVATVPDLAALAAEIGGEHLKVTAMALPTQDPHFVDAKPSLVLELSRADLLLVQGLDLEVGWLPTLLTGSRNAAIQPGGRGYLDCSTLVRVVEAATAPVDRSMGDIHPGGNPHYTLDPRAVISVAQGIGERLAVLDPEHAAEYRASATRLSVAVAEQQAGWETELSGLHGKPVVTYHRSLTYLADWLGLDVVDNIEPKPGIPPNPKHVAHVLHVIEERHVRLVLQESWYPRTTSELVAAESGARLVVIPGATDFAGGQSWLDHMGELVAALRAAQEGT